MITLEELHKKYDGFAVPAFKISAGGSELSRRDFTFDDISVDLCAGETCGGCRFLVRGIYERGARKIAPAALDKLKPGTLLAVSLGYGSKFTPVFSGYVSELKMCFDEKGLYFVVYGLDVRGLMRENTRRVIYKDKKMTDVVDLILKDYSALIASKSVNLTVLEQKISIVQDSDDLSFLLMAADNRGLLVYMHHDKFVMDKVADTVCLELDWEAFELEFSIKYLDADITGIGCDSSSMKRFNATKPAKQKASQAGLITTKRHIALAPYWAGDYAAKVVEAAAQTAVREAGQGMITYRHGIPEATVGQKVKINKFPLVPSKTGDTFSIVSVGHRIDEESGFTTTIGITG